MAPRRCFGRLFGARSAAEERRERAELAPFRHVAISVIRDNLAESIALATHGGRPIVLVRRRRPVAALVTVDALRRLVRFEQQAGEAEAEWNSPEAQEERERRRVKLEGQRSQVLSEIGELEERAGRLDAEERLAWQEAFVLNDPELRQRLWDRKWRATDDLSSTQDRLSRLRGTLGQIDLELAALGPAPETEEPLDGFGPVAPTLPELP